MKATKYKRTCTSYLKGRDEDEHKEMYATRNENMPKKRMHPHDIQYPCITHAHHPRLLLFLPQNARIAIEQPYEAPLLWAPELPGRVPELVLAREIVVYGDEDSERRRLAVLRKGWRKGPMKRERT